MQSMTIDKAALTHSGNEALRRGDARKAREAFERIVAAGLADAPTLLALAHACRSLEDRAAALDAVDRALALDPRNWLALIFKGDHLEAAGDGRSASTYYLQAVHLAPAPEELPAATRDEVLRARAACERYAARFQSFLGERLASSGFADGKSPRRFTHALDLLFGRRQVFVQQPRFFYYPELAQVQFFDRAQFPWLDAVEGASGDIREELMGVLADEAAFTPYVERDPNRPPGDQMGLLDNPAWSAFYLVKNGAVVEANAARCPRTMAAMEGVPLARVATRSPSVLFSLLRPGAHIPPHNGFVNTRLICHLPLVVPGRCTFRVGNEMRDWQEGRAWVFDDTIEHEAWNRSEGVRVILLFEIWRPELSEEERRLVGATFEAIDAYGAAPAWEI
jgi:aspartyl/asparaginyl beta-hydroxylase (cupin superfamily)